jgi:Mrp family chromosome partitioning ATPase/uncharacterized protein involved in exopolysaccharide biosynthesis
MQPVPLYRSEAELYVKYVLDSRTVSTSTKETSLDDQGQNIMNAEMKIITSLDIANKVALTIGPAKILAKILPGDTNAADAGIYIKSYLMVASDGGGVINVAFHHPDDKIVQSVLTEVISEYFSKHEEIHQSADVTDDALNEEAIQLRSDITETERKLREEKTNAQILSLDSAEASYSAQYSKMQGQLYDAQTELAERQAMVMRLTNFLAITSATVTNAIVENTNTAVEVPSDRRVEYNKICSRLELLQKRVDDLLTVQGYKEENTRVKDVRDQIADSTKQKESLEKSYPQLAASSAPSDSHSQPNGLYDDLATNLKQIDILESRMQVLSNQMFQVRMAAADVDVAGSRIQDLQRDKQIDEGNYQYLKTRLSEVKLDEKLAPGTVSGIKAIQNPTPAFKEPTAPLKQPLRMVFGGIFAGLGLAFLIELFLDRSMKRPIEIETKLKLPLFLSLPDLSKIGLVDLASATKRRQLQFKNGQESSVSTVVANGTSLVKNGGRETTPSNHNGILQPFCDALRDRLITYFENKNITHKPKLVAVTSPHKGSGVTTIAAGLAASLSETGDGNVLLVDMNIDNGEMQKFFKGKSIGQLDDLLEGKTRDNALVQENLYVVTEGRNGEGVSRILPKRFAAIVPKLKASDYDYIIFDMPPVSQTSITARLSSFMDMVLLVIESEKTGCEVAQRANALLAESNATVSAVLNKTKKYVPNRLQPHDFYHS